jgi:hypothetical protein
MRLLFYLELELRVGEGVAKYDLRAEELLLEGQEVVPFDFDHRFV